MSNLVFDELQERGLIAQTTNQEKLRDLINNGKIYFYIGFDPTADSLHVGHLVQLIVMAHMQRAGHVPIALFGGGTGMIGDPSGKTDMRRMMTKEEIEYNISCFKRQMSSVIDFSDGKAIIENNGDWLMDLNYIKFIREIGVHFPVNKMLAAECYKQRLERGLSFFEMNYMIMQSYDFLQLNRKYGCVAEFGGDDQWSNIIGGVELIRRVESKEVFGMTFSLLTKSDGQKMGKTEKGAVWLDPDKVSPFEFYQYFRNVDDADVIKFLKILTFLPLEEISKLSTLSGNEINKAKEILAFEVTKIIHGEEAAKNARDSARTLFSKGSMNTEMPSTLISMNEIPDDGILVIDAMVKTGLCNTKSEARRLISQGGISINSKKVCDVLEKIKRSYFEDGSVVIRKGKKVFHKLILE